MSLNAVEINSTIKFSIDDTGMELLISMLAASGSVLLDCPWCGLTVLPQARAALHATGKNEQKVVCVGCGRKVNVRIFPDYGFVLDDDIKPTRYTGGEI